MSEHLEGLLEMTRERAQEAEQALAEALARIKKMESEMESDGKTYLERIDGLNAIADDYHSRLKDAISRAERAEAEISEWKRRIEKATDAWGDRVERAEAERDAWKDARRIAEERHQYDSLKLMRERDAALADNAALCEEMLAQAELMTDGAAANDLRKVAEQPHPGADLLAEVEALRAVEDEARHFEEAVKYYQGFGYKRGPMADALTALDDLRGGKE